ncbi:MAG: chemotaxis protein CheW [Spirochaetota bacterium]|nr:chemotaxis protein CheW [Spirochaetota bacterium]
MREVLHINLSGMDYGVWADEVVFTKDKHALHHLPLVQSYVSGISLINDHVVTLADLSACIGLSPLNSREGFVLILSEEENIAGFATEGRIGHYKIADEEIFSLPDYLQTSIIDKCILHNHKPIPIINIPALYELVQKDSFKPGDFEFLDAEAKHMDISSINGFRLIEDSGELFAFPDVNVLEMMALPKNVSPVSSIPKYIKGIAFHKSNILPIVSLSQRMNLMDKYTEEEMLVVDIEGSSYGFLIDRLISHHNGNGHIHILPPLVQSSWMNNATMYNSDIIPIVDPIAMITIRSDDKDETPLYLRYNPNSEFESIFGVEEVEVIEFSLLGARYALPKSEVIDSLSFKSYRRVPNVKSIVVGVAEYEEKLLPVLDLALCFGRHSPVSEDWKMILVENGDFKALVITEHIYKERLVSVATQHSLPIMLPHRLVYGCYTDEETNTVKLILNVEVMAVHFDETAVKEYFYQISREIESSLGMTSSSPKDDDEIAVPIKIIGVEDDYVEELGPSVESTVVHNEEELSATMDGVVVEDKEELASQVDSTLVDGDELSASSATIAIDDEEELSATMDDVVVENKEELASQVVSTQVDEDELSASSTTISIDDEEELTATMDGVVVEDKEELASQVDSTLVDEDELSASSATIAIDDEEELTATMDDVVVENKEELASQVDSTLVDEDELSASSTTIAIDDEEEFTTPTKTIEVEDESEEGEYVLPEFSSIEEEVNDDETMIEDEKSQREISESLDSIGKEDNNSKESNSTATEIIDISREPLQGPIETDTSQRRKKKYTFAAVAAIIIIAVYTLIAYISNNYDRIDGEKSFDTIHRGESDFTDSKKPEPTLEEHASVSDTQANIQTSQTQKTLSDSDSPSGYVVYEVIRGDTLYEITEKFTGYGFDYHQVAKENNIKNPDLIFPRQKIKYNQKLIKKDDYKPSQ